MATDDRSELALRFEGVAAAFTERVAGVTGDGWERPSPCEGWVARNIVGHLVSWVPAFMAAAGGPTFTAGPSVDDDPLGAWGNLRDQLQAALDDQALAATTIAHPQAGTHRLEDAIAMFVLGDVLIHTWDLARATGQDEALLPEEVRRMREGLEPMADMLAASGHYAPVVPTADDADDQTRLLALTGRKP